MDCMHSCVASPEGKLEFGIDNKEANECNDVNDRRNAEK